MKPGDNVIIHTNICGNYRGRLTVIDKDITLANAANHNGVPRGTVILSMREIKLIKII